MNRAYRQTLLKFLVAFFAMPLPICARVAHAELVVASNFPPTWQFSGFREDVGYAASTDGGFLNTSHSQRFVPTHGGKLSSLTVFMDYRVIGDPLLVAIRTDSGGLPAALLGEASFKAGHFPANYFPPNPPTRLDMLALDVILQAGTTYHAVFRTAHALQNSWYFSSHMLNPHSGSFQLPELFSRNSMGDWTVAPFGLETALRVAIVPEPATECLALLAALLACLQRRVRAAA